MKILYPLAAFCLICSISAISLASGETIDLGPAQISMDLKSLGSYSVEKGSPSSMDHHEREADFKYNIYPAKVTTDGTSDQVQIEVHEMSTSMPLETSISRKDTSIGLEHCIEQSDIIAGTMDLHTVPYSIDGHDGVLAQINDEDSKDPMYIVAYSPDQKDGSGKVVCVVGSDFPWETTKAIFDSLDAKMA
jgi:hypothetical protein